MSENYPMSFPDEILPAYKLPEASPQRDALLKLLESEIALLTQRQKNSGWTSWALVAAIGAICWTLVQQWESGWPNNGRWLLVYMSLLFGFYLLRYIVRAFQFKVYSSGAATRFDLGAQMDSRVSIAWSICQCFIWALCLWCAKSFSMVTICAVGVICLVCFAFNVLVFALSFADFPVPSRASLGNAIAGSVASVRTRKVAFAVMILIIMAGAAIPFFFMGRDCLNSLPIAVDVKLGGLFAALGFLIKALLEEIDSQPLIEDLLWVRRELVLGGMSIEEAVRRLEVEFLGLRVSDVFRDSAQEFGKHAAIIEVECRAIIARIDAVELLSAESRHLPEQRAVTSQAVYESCQSAVQTVAEKLSRLDAELKSIDARGHLFLGMATDASVARQEILRVLGRRYQKIVAVSKEMERRVNKLTASAHV